MDAVEDDAFEGAAAEAVEAVEADVVEPFAVVFFGVGLFYRSNLPIKVRSDLSFPECIVVELKVKRKSLFYTTLYRSPAYNNNYPEINLFLENFKNLYSKIQVEKPLAMFFSGDFNAHSISWWPDGKNNHEGKKLEELFTTLGLHQLIHEPTNFEPKKNPSCIDLILYSTVVRVHH